MRSECAAAFRSLRSMGHWSTVNRDKLTVTFDRTTINSNYISRLPSAWLCLHFEYIDTCNTYLFRPIEFIILDTSSTKKPLGTSKLINKDVVYSTIKLGILLRVAICI